MTDPSTMLARIDDLNLARLNLISAQDRNNSDQREWTVRYEVGDRIVRVACTALPELGIPHGTDNDVQVALLAYFHECGQPQDGVLEISASHLMTLCGFHRNGEYYARIKESLRRLHTTSYEVSGGWRDHPKRRWTTVTFHIISSLAYTTKEDAGPFDERTIIRLKLADEIVASVRAGYTKPLNLEFMHKLSRPRTRILFRLLDATRIHPERLEDVTDAFDVGLLEWADQCKISSDRPDAVRKALEGPHQELIRHGYLRSVTYEGRGSKQRIVYAFSPDFLPMSPALLERFRKHGVADGVSRTLARTYPASLLMREVTRFESLLRSGQLVPKKSAAAALVHLIKHPDQYADVRSDALPARTAGPARVEPTEDGDAARSLRDEWNATRDDRRPDLLVKRVSFFFRGSFTPLELDALRAAVTEGRVDGLTILLDGLKALSRVEAQTFVHTLRARISEWH